MTEEAPLETITIVYLGKRMSDANKIIHLFIPEDTLLAALPEGTFPFPADITVHIDRKASAYVLKKSPDATVGVRYEAQGRIENGRIMSMVLNRLVFKGFADKWETFVPAWRTAHSEAEREKQGMSIAKNADADPLMTQAMRVLRMRYARVPAMQKRAFQFWVLDEMAKR